jgi:urease accessory protein
MTVRPTGTPELARVHLVAGAFGPLGGDDLALEVLVGPGAELEIAGVAASVAQRSRDGSPSKLEVRVSVGADARLLLALPPTIVTAGASHTIDTRVDVAESGWLILREEIVRGRTGEPGGEAVLRTHLEVERRPVLSQQYDLCGPVGGAWRPRAAGSLLLVGHPLRPETIKDLPAGVRTAGLRFGAGDACQLTAQSDDPLALRQFLDRAQAAAQLPR